MSNVLQAERRAGSVVSMEQVSIVFDGTMTTPQLDHAEGLAIDPDGVVYCGGERGQIYRLELDGGKFEQVGETGGFCLGMALSPAGDLFICDSKLAAVMRFDTKSGRVEKFADGADGHRMKIPNVPLFDAAGNLYVSDSYDFKVLGPGVFRFDTDGNGTLWCDQDFNFANGLAISPDGRSMYVAESFASAISRVPILEDGSAGPKAHVAYAGKVPDGLACDADGRIYVASYEPSAIYRIDPATGEVETVVHDEEAVFLCHPTNVAFWKGDLYAVNLGKCHISRIALGVEGAGRPLKRADGGIER